LSTDAYRTVDRKTEVVGGTGSSPLPYAKIISHAWMTTATGKMVSRILMQHTHGRYSTGDESSCRVIHLSVIVE
jgi:hypothetical protein